MIGMITRSQKDPQVSCPTTVTRSRRDRLEHAHRPAQQLGSVPGIGVGEEQQVATGGAIIPARRPTACRTSPAGSSAPSSRRIRESRVAYWRTTSAVASVERSSTTMISKGSYRVSSRESRSVGRLSSSFRAGTIIEASRPVARGASARFGRRRANRAKARNGAAHGRAAQASE